jgi:DNA-binding MarR family transcriptional regulator
MALRRLVAAGADATQALARRMGMHPTDLAAMGHIAFAGEPMGPGEVGARLGLSPAATTELVDRLEVAGHLARERDTVDRRRVRLVPTASARTEVSEQLRGLLDALGELVETFDAEERAVVLRFLDGATEAYLRYARDAGGGSG